MSLKNGNKVYKSAHLTDEDIDMAVVPLWRTRNPDDPAHKKVIAQIQTEAEHIRALLKQ